MFTEEVNKIALSGIDERGIQSIDCRVTYSCGTSENIIIKKEEIKYRNIKLQYKNT